MNQIYLDYAATTPCDPQVLEAMKPFFFEKFGNASSPHQTGQEAKKAIEDARGILANFIACDPAEIVFTSGATESNNHAIFGLAQKADESKKEIIVSKIEHHSILEPIEYLQKYGYSIKWLEVDEFGVVNPDDVKKLITDQTLCIAVMHASNEIGTIQPIAEIGAIAKEYGVPFIIDACQTVGHIPVNVNDLNCDLLSFSAHKFYGPKAVGGLYIKKGSKLGRYLFGGDQERDRRASTQNVSGIVGMGKAIELVSSSMQEEANQQQLWQEKIIKSVAQNIDGARLNGHPANRLPNNIHFSFDGLLGESLLTALDLNGIAVSMGSACTSGVLGPSHVLKAIGLSDQQALGALRVTLGRWTTNAEIEKLIEQLTQVVKRLRFSE